MPANHKVSVAWQIAFTFLPILNLWAFYRIRKLRKYVLYVIVPSIVVSGYYLSETGLWFSAPAWAAVNTVDPDVYDPITLTEILANVILWVLQGFAIYLVIIWSRKHNQHFDQPQTAP